MKRTLGYAAMTHPVESALPSRTAGIQQGRDEVQHGRMTFYEAVNDVFVYGALPEAGIQVNNRLPGVFSLFPTTGTAYSLFSLTVI